MISRGDWVPLSCLSADFPVSMPCDERPLAWSADIVPLSITSGQTLIDGHSDSTIGEAMIAFDWRPTN